MAMRNDKNEIQFDLRAEPVRQESIDLVAASLQVSVNALEKRFTLDMWLMGALLAGAVIALPFFVVRFFHQVASGEFETTVLSVLFWGGRSWWHMGSSSPWPVPGGPSC
ncbi:MULTISPECIES: hypothetical protein [unclassified Thioalkalivibrio]|uniref:hypothetical protein n=1 Tax=unclassified Thioalkalivibrio TaxID=2621013 RepID=UPI00037C2F7F|nr:MULTISPECIES: hypothetical protein [unclassified Thioalkalivibrio]